MSKASVPALLRQQVDRWADMWLKDENGIRNPVSVAGRALRHRPAYDLDLFPCFLRRDGLELVLSDVVLAMRDGSFGRAECQSQ
jgi:hypothetical protein